MAENLDRISNVSRVSSDVSLSQEEMKTLSQRKSMLEQELSSLNVILKNSKVSKSVPNPSINRESIISVTPHAATSIADESPFCGFSHFSTPYFRRVGARFGTNIYMETPIHEQTRQMCQVSDNRVIPTERISNISIAPSQQPRLQDVDDIISQNNSLRNDNSNRLMGLRTIDEWADDVCDHNSRQSIRSTTTKHHELPLLHQQRDNDRGSTHVELLNSSTVAPRYGQLGYSSECGFCTERFSMEPKGVDTRSFVSQHPSQWGSTHVELLNTSRDSGERELVLNHRVEQLDQQTQGAVGQSCNIQRNTKLNWNTIKRRQPGNSNAEMGICNCDNVSCHQSQNRYIGLGSTHVELLNTFPYDKFCLDDHRHINDLNPRQVLREIPGQGERKYGNNFQNQFTDMGAPIANRTPTRNDRESQERLNQHDGVVDDQQMDFAQSKSNLPTQNFQRQTNNDDGVLKKLVSRQILGKDIPEYRGETLKWLSFIDHYNDTTDSCNFTDRENIMRLRKCLKGPAEALVAPLLVSSTDPKIIINILQRRFGRPDDIIKAEIARVKEIPSPQEDDPQSIIEFATAVQNLAVTLETLKKANHLKNPILLDELQDKLPPTLSLMWSEYIFDRKEDLSLRVLSDWLDRRADAASRRTTLKVYNVVSTPKSKLKQKARVNAVIASSDAAVSTIVSSCNSCHGTCKSLEQCEAFSKLDVHKRWDIAKKNKLCFFCLSSNHEFKDCSKKVECKIKGCKRFHHKLLHTHSCKKVGIIKANLNSHVTKLRIVPVILYGSSGEVKTFALLDPGSTSTLMSEELANSLKLDGPNSPLLLEWMNGDMAVENDSKIVDTKIQGTQDGAKIYDLFNVRTVKHLPLHKQTINKSALVKQWPYLRTVEFEGYENAQPQLLIGENNGLLTATRQLVHDKWNTPIASKTWLGWVISGNEGKSTDTTVVKIFTAHEVQTDTLHELVKSSFNLDEAGVSSQKLSRSKEDDRAVELLEKYSSINDNRWETGLLWRDEQVVLPESRKNALLRLIILEKKLDKNPVLRQRYSEIIGEYLDKKFLRKCEKSDTKFKRSWYLPHFPILYPLKPGKVRIVFDAAAKSNGSSLNDYLMPGPDYLKSLVSVIFKFRHGKIGFLGDIKDMFHRIKMRKADASCQKILWRGDSRSDEPEEYELDVMSFGANCSPCSAIYIKDRNAIRFQEEFPQAVDAILNKHYMDDYLDSTNDEADAINLIKDVIHIHQQGSFEIRNWISSSQVVMQSIPEQLHRNRDGKVSFDHENLQDRVLGILWDPTEDVFTFNVDFAKIDKTLLSGEKKPTKREILTIINSVFDPLGFVAHLMIVGKIILKNVWSTGIKWDDVIDDKTFETWKSFLGHMQRITEVKIDRCYSINFMQAENLQLHVFCDASIEAYCAIAFFRIKVGEKVEVKFVMAKTRVAPSKNATSLTIPRLELEAALLGSKISQTIITEHNVKFDKVVLWTDNTAVWYWIQSETKRYKQFVANRLGEILELTNPSNWMWVPTDMNPADDATRSNKIPEFGQIARWYRGPDFLYETQTHWPQQPNKRLELSNDLLEVLEFNNFVIETPHFQVPDATRFSKWLRMLRATAWILRFVNNCKRKTKVDGLELTVDETSRAETLLVKHSQRICFPNELSCLQKGKTVDVTSRLYSLCPKLDENGIIRMHGRTDRLSESFRGVKEPVILDGKDYCVKLIIRFFHEKANHFGHEMVLNELRQRYWIVGARVALRAVRNECSKCKLLLVQPSKIIMGQLPTARITGGNPPFTFCGVDYFGPILVKQGRAVVKRYGVLFTCLTIRAVHIEIAHSLTTDSCIMALRRFVARYICPTEMYSDNGTNLHGCDNELRENLKELDQNKIRGWATTHRIKWHFNPPTASSMGGSWERLVRSIKTALYATLKSIHPSDEVLATLLAEAQHVTNSRPLLEISDHPSEEETLTPNHFLIGRSSASAPIGEFDSDDLILKKQWRAAQHLADLFWARWLKEFLPTLTKRTKWWLTTRRPQIGDLVLIADIDEKRGHWPKGIITATFPGIDNEIRVVDVTTQSGTYRRPMNKICILESTVAPNATVQGENV